ncbi:MAG: hypothetical protein GY884_01205, partial [Proteobacteria bacterium]|nr:hypothetical protein [Pseudomonadota bacterium]
MSLGDPYGGDPQTTWEWSADASTVTTDDAGAFRLGNLYPGPFVLRMTDGDDPELFSELDVEAGSEDLELVLDAASARRITLRGKVVDAVTGAPIPSFVVTPMRPDSDSGSSGSNHSFEDTDGTFELHVPVGRSIELPGKAEGYAELRLPDRPYEPGVHEVTLSLPPARTLQVLATRVEDGSSAEGGVRVFDGDGQRLMLEKGSGTRSRLELVDGTVQLKGLPAQRLRVVLEGSAIEDQERWIDLSVPTETPMVFVVQRPAPVAMGQLQLLFVCEGVGASGD